MKGFYYNNYSRIGSVRIRDDSGVGMDRAVARMTEKCSRLLTEKSSTRRVCDARLTVDVHALLCKKIYNSRTKIVVFNKKNCSLGRKKIEFEIPTL